MNDRPAPNSELQRLRQERATLAREVEWLRGELAAAMRMAARRDEAQTAENLGHAGQLAASEARTATAEVDAHSAWTRAADLGASLGRRIAEGQARLIASQAAVASLERANAGLAAGHAAIALREADLRSVIESAIDCAIVTTDFGGLVLAWNSGARRLIGWDEAKATAMSLDAVLPPEDRAGRGLAADIAAALSGTRISREGWLQRQDGGRVWAGIEAMALRADGADEPVGVLWMLRDRSVAQLAEQSLRASEARLATLLDLVPFGIGQFDTEGRFVLTNPALRGLVGDVIPSREVPLRWRSYDAAGREVPRHDFPAARALRGEAVPVGMQFVTEADAVPRWFEVGAVPLRNDGVVTGGICVTVDVTERRSAEAALRESEERYRTLFASIDSGFCVVELRFDAPDGRADYRVVEANPAFYRQTGFPEAILGRWLREAAPALEEHWYDIYGRVARTGEPERFERASDMLGRWFDVYAFRIGPPERRRVAVLFNDISARRSAEARLRELNETLEQQVAERTAERDRMWETSADLMLVLDFKGFLRRVNPAWTALLGYAPGELVGHHVNEFVLPDDHRETVAAYELAAGGGRPRIVNRYWHKDGSTRWISWVAAPAGDMTYATGRDVTREKEREAELARAQEALRQAQKLEAIGQLTGGIAHDFNNMLQGVAGGLEMARRRMDAGRLEDAARYIDAARDATGRAAGLTRRLLGFARQQRLDPRPVDPDALMRGMAEMLRRTLGPAIALELAVEDGCGFVTCDPNELESALLNLCINARDAMPDGGRLALSTRDCSLSGADLEGAAEVAPGPFVEIAVADTGSGMTPEVLDRVLEPFFTTKPLGQGTGLGLSQVYGFVRQSGGALRIESSPGRGTTVRLWLPYSPRRQLAGEMPGDAATPSREECGATVLLVDDETGVREPAAARLRDLGYAVVEALDGPSALRLLENGLRPHLLLTDVGLPGRMDGTRVAAAARQRLPELAVVFMTGYAKAPLPHEAEVITKPFTLDALTARVRSALAAAAGGRS